MPNLYAPSDAQPLLGHAQRFREMFGVSADASPYLELGLRFEYGQPWAVEALDFFRRYPQARWHWMDVPANGDYHVLTLKVVIDGVHVEMGGGSHFTLFQAQAITDDFRAIRATAKAAEPPPPEPEHRCPRCAHGWDDE